MDMDRGDVGLDNDSTSTNDVMGDEEDSVVGLNEERKR